MDFRRKFDKFANQTGRNSQDIFHLDSLPFDSWKVFLITPSSWQRNN